MINQKLAVVFPGQGSQSVGMLHKVALEAPVILKTFEEASEVLGYDLWRLTQEGPSEKLSQTTYTQPALLAAGVALWRLHLENVPLKPRYLAGHSLGEYTALVCANALGFQEAVQLVALRGQLMQDAVPEGQGAMAAILGLDDPAVAALCESVSLENPTETVSPANYNTPGQVVIAGHTKAVLRVLEHAKAAGARRSLLLPVSVPSHCALMKPAALHLAQALEKIAFRTPFIPILHNSDVAEHQTPQSIRQALVEQLSQPVQWVRTIRFILAAGVQTVYECGPGSVLCGLNRRIEPTIDCIGLSNKETACVPE